MGNLHIINGTAPTAGVANGAILYAEDVAASSELKVMDEAANITTLSPHNFTLFQPNESYTFPWSYYSRNHFIGREINVDIYGAIKEIEAMSGKQFIYERELPEEEKLDWDEDQQRKQDERAAIIQVLQERRDAGDDIEIPRPYTKKQAPSWLRNRIAAAAAAAAPQGPPHG